MEASGPPRSHRDALVRLYTRLDPSKLKNVQTILDKFAHAPFEMYAVLERLYPGENIERPVRSRRAESSVRSAVKIHGWAQRARSSRRKMKMSEKDAAADLM